MINGFVVNNTGRSRHIFKKTVYPGQKVPLSYVYQVVSSKVDGEDSFVDWLKSRLPPGWELDVNEEFELPIDATAVSADEVKVVEKEPAAPDEDRESLEYAPLKIIDKLTARDVYNLRIKDNPKRVIKQITSVHKLRRALTLCKNDSRKSMLATIIRHRIKELTG